MSTPWENPSSPSNDFDLSSFISCTLLFAVGGCHPNQTTRFGVKPVVRANLVVLNGEKAGTEYSDILVFNSRVVRQLRGSAGKAILATVVLDPTSTQGALALEEASDEMKNYASEWNLTYPGRIEGLVKAAVEAFHVEEQRQQSAPPMPPAYQPPRNVTAPPRPSAPPPLPPPPAAAAPSTFDSPPF